MKKLIRELSQEFIFIFKGKTLDTIVPPIVFLVSLNWFNLATAILTSFAVSFVLLLYRLYKKETQNYAIIGMIALAIAALFSYLGNNPATYFIPDILGSVLSFLLAIISLVIKKPLAAYASHFTRGWPLDWFWRTDVRPAYRDVTIFWAFYFLMRSVTETILYLSDDIKGFVLFNTVVGFPLLIGVLTLSYVYGIWKLKKLKGPGVDEFIEQKEPPFRGQTRGF